MDRGIIEAINGGGLAMAGRSGITAGRADGDVMMVVLIAVYEDDTVEVSEWERRPEVPESLRLACASVTPRCVPD